MSEPKITVKERVVYLGEIEVANWRESRFLFWKSWEVNIDLGWSCRGQAYFKSESEAEKTAIRAVKAWLISAGIGE